MDKGAKAIVAVIAADKTPPVRDSVEYDFSRELLFSMSSLYTVRESQLSSGEFQIAQLHALNFAFLSLLRTGGATMSIMAGAEHWSGATLRLLSELSLEGMQRVAACPFALFDLNAIVKAQENRLCDAAAAHDAAAHASLSQFANAALFYAWHELSLAPARARLRFGLEAGAAATLRRLTPSELAACASGCRLVMPRCVRHAQFWEMLLERSKQGDVRKMQAAFWLGRQLVSDEMRSK